MPTSLSHRIAVYTGVFDPPHFGHLDVIQRGSRIYDRLIVGVGENPEKSPFFTQQERVELLRRVLTSEKNVDVQQFNDLAIRFVRQVGAKVMLRGLRTLSDMEYEFTMSLMNLGMDPEIETVFLMAKEEFSHVSGTLIRQIASMQGPLHKFVPAEIQKALQDRVRELEAQGKRVQPPVRE
jgi:pantetheine-phosphate adenylyltransferase